jgi:hypothetical protein
VYAKYTRECPPREGAISMWKDSRKVRFLFINLEKYLAGRVEVELEDGEDFHP